MIYLASPYDDPDESVRETRYLNACKACAMLTKRQLVVYSPIVHWHMVAKFYKLPKGHEYWKFHDRHMILLGESFWILKLHGWQESVGIHKERLFAKSHHRPVRYITLEECSKI